MSKIILYCDGGARNNGKENNVGGYGVFLQFGEHTKELYQGYRNVTNNQMEIRAAIDGLAALTKFNIPVEVRTDSAYVCNCKLQNINLYITPHVHFFPIWIFKLQNTAENVHIQYHYI